jgi:hypothetical protein
VPGDESRGRRGRAGDDGQGPSAWGNPQSQRFSFDLARRESKSVGSFLLRALNIVGRGVIATGQYAKIEMNRS